MKDNPTDDKLTGSPCRNCPEGTYSPGRVSELLERGGVTVVAKGVPAQVCDVCGDALMTTETASRLEEILKGAEAEGVELEVRRFAAEPTTV